MDELRTINIIEYLDDIYYRWKVEVKDSNGYRAAWFDDWEDVLKQVEIELSPNKNEKGRPKRLWKNNLTRRL